MKYTQSGLHRPQTYTNPCHPKYWKPDTIKCGAFCAGADFTHPCEQSLLSNCNWRKMSNAIIKWKPPINVGVQARGKNKRQVSGLTLRGGCHLMNAGAQKTQQPYFRRPCFLIIAFFTGQCILRGCVPTHWRVFADWGVGVRLEMQSWYAQGLLATFSEVLLFWVAGVRRGRQTETNLSVPTRGCFKRASVPAEGLLNWFYQCSAAAVSSFSKCPTVVGSLLGQASESEALLLNSDWVVMGWGVPMFCRT